MAISRLKTGSGRADGSVKAEPNQRSSKEIAGLNAFAGKGAKRPLRPKMKIVTEPEARGLSINHRNPADGWMLLMESLGTTDLEITKLITHQLGEITQKDGVFDIQSLNMALALVQGIGPKDEIELMLATQMAAIHISTMVQARRLHGADNLDQQNSSSNSLNKLSRTFTGQVDALKRYRTGGVQKVIVQHVHVNEGGQAVVAGELTGGGGSHGKDIQPHEREDLRISERATVLSAIEALGVPMQGAGR